MDFLCGWVLALFNVDDICIEVIQQFISFELTTAHYYFVFGLLGMIYGIIHN